MGLDVSNHHSKINQQILVACVFSFAVGSRQLKGAWGKEGFASKVRLKARSGVRSSDEALGVRTPVRLG